jgi:hypothetical protein
MADYLSSVVARANPTTPALSPRVPSLFEPPATLLSVPLPMPTRRQTTAPAAVRERIPAPDAAISAPDPRPPETAPDKPIRQQAPELAVAVVINDDVPTTDGPTRLVRSSTNTSEPRESKPTLEVIEQEKHDPIRALVARARPHDASAAPAALEPAPMRDSRAQAQRRDDAASPITAARPESNAREPVQTVKAPSPQRPTEAAPQSPSLRDRAVAPPPLELETQRPVVNVVIERLSVQAITSTSAPPRPSAPAPPPSMSLEQYLQRRSTRS